eukprot:gene3701-7361_t
MCPNALSVNNRQRQLLKEAAMHHNRKNELNGLHEMVPCYSNSYIFKEISVLDYERLIGVFCRYPSSKFREIPVIFLQEVNLSSKIAPIDILKSYFGGVEALKTRKCSTVKYVQRILQPPIRRGIVKNELFVKAAKRITLT